MPELPEGIVIRIGMFKEQLRADIRETAIKDENITFLKSGVNVSVFHFLQILRKLKEEYSSSVPSSSSSSKETQDAAGADEDEESSDPPPAKKPKQTLSKAHHSKEARAKSFKKGVKAVKRKVTVVTSDEESN